MHVYNRFRSYQFMLLTTSKLTMKVAKLEGSLVNFTKSSVGKAFTFGFGCVVKIGILTFKELPKPTKKKSSSNSD